MSYKRIAKEREVLIRKKIQEFANSLIWSNDDGSEKYIAVGNMADFIINLVEEEIENERCNIRKFVSPLIQKFIDKVDRGEARSKETYQDMKIIKEFLL